MSNLKTFAKSAGILATGGLCGALAIEVCQFFNSAATEIRPQDYFQQSLGVLLVTCAGYFVPLILHAPRPTSNSGLALGGILGISMMAGALFADFPSYAQADTQDKSYATQSHNADLSLRPA